jgi:cyclopropane-fatty-acyl-phospholipid synthase
MRLAKPLDFPQPWSRRVVVSLFAMVTSGYRVRLDFSDGEQVVVGPTSGPISVAVSPPPFWRTIWIFLNPGLRVGQDFVHGRWRITEGDLATFMRIIQIPRSSLYARLYSWFSDRRGPIFYMRQLVFTEWNRRAGSKHYDEGKELYESMLDSSMQYSCAFFSLSRSDDLEVAQRVKLQTSIYRLHLDRPRLKVLDIGCGWGALAVEIAQRSENHDVVGITLSRDQFEGAASRRENLDPDVRHRLEFRLEDYRYYLANPDNDFDRIISIGMVEHVGLGRHVHFYSLIQRNLRSGGVALIHSIVRPSPGAYNEWIRQNIFPGSFLPSLAEMISGAEKVGLIVDAVHVHPPSDYAKTLREWRKRVESAWPELQKRRPTRFDQQVKRRWIFYLASMEAAFAEDTLNFRIAQVELRKI